MKKTDKKRGFTLVELVIVIAIIGILATVTVVGVTSALNKANEVKALEEARGLYTEYLFENPTAEPGDVYYVEVGEYWFKIDNGEFTTVDEAGTDGTVITESAD